VIGLLVAALALWLVGGAFLVRRYKHVIARAQAIRSLMQRDDLREPDIIDRLASLDDPDGPIALRVLAWDEKQKLVNGMFRMVENMAQTLGQRRDG